MKKLIGTIDLTPTWLAMAPIIIAAMENGTSDGVKMAKEEIYKMAKLADAYAASRVPNIEKGDDR